jgi:hypothetical protein
MTAAPLTPALRPGYSAYRITERGTCVRCIVKRVVGGAFVEVRSSAFSKEVLKLRAEDVFADRQACRAEIKLRKEAAVTP